MISYAKLNFLITSYGKIKNIKKFIMLLTMVLFWFSNVMSSFSYGFDGKGGVQDISQKLERMNKLFKNTKYSDLGNGFKENDGGKKQKKVSALKRSVKDKG